MAAIIFTSRAAQTEQLYVTISLIVYQLDKERHDELSISLQAIPPHETDRIDRSWTVVFLPRSRGPNRISHETKDFLTMKSSQVGERDRTAGRGHGRRVKKENSGKMGEEGNKNK